MATRSQALAWGVAIAAGCDGLITVGPVDVQPDPPLLTEPELILEQPVSFAAGIGNERVAAVLRGDGSFVRAAAAEAPVSLGDDAGSVNAVTVFDDEPLVGGENGLFVIRGDFLEPSGLNAVLDGREVLDLCSNSDERRLWLVTPDTLFLWRDGRMISTTIPDFDLRAAHCTPHRERGLWLVAGGRLVRLDDDGDVLSVTEPDASLDVAHVAADSRGSLWVALENGSLRERTGAGTWIEWRLPITIEAVAGDPASSDTWLLGSDEVWHQRNQRFGPVSGVPPHDYRAADRGGGLLVSGEAGLLRVRPDLSIDFVGAEPNVVITWARTFEIHVPFSSAVVAIDAEIEGVAQRVEADPWRVTIDPWSINDDATLLAVAASYSNGSAPVTGELPFSIGEVPVVSFNADLAPISERSCASCHGAGATTPLHDADAWRERYDASRSEVNQGRMPPGRPLSAIERAVIGGWEAGGFAP